MFLLAWLILILVISVVSIKGPRTSLPVDKAVHFILYGITAIFFYRHFIEKLGEKRTLFLSVVCSSVYGGALEILQHFVPGRSFSLGDMAANATGSAVLCLIYASISRYPEKN